jgi:predicted transcriptional regulator
MLTSVQKEILQSLINLYRNADASIKGEEIALIMNRNPGTIRNQMQSLRSLGLVKGVPGPRGGYKPTIKAYHTLNIQASDNQTLVPIFRDGKKVKDITVSQIEFTSITHPGECEAAIKAVGNIKYLDLGDEIRIGPTPVNKLVVDGVVVGRDDMDNILLLDTTAIRSIPKKTVFDVASKELINLNSTDNIKEAAIVLSNGGIEGAPVIENGHIVGILTLSDIISAIAKDNDNLKVEDIMSKHIITVDKDVVNDKDTTNPIGIITRTDLLDQIAGLK